MKKCDVISTVPKLIAESYAATQRANRGRASPAEPGSGVRGVSGEGVGNSPQRAEEDLAARARATVVSLSGDVAKSDTAHEAQEQTSANEQLTESRVEAIVAEIREVIAATDRTGIRVQPDVHEETGQYIMRVIESETGEVLKEFPPVEYLDMVAALEDLEGLLMRKEL